LKAISGVGGKTIADIKRIYESEEHLIDALRNDLVPLRDDIVEKLKEYYEI